MNNKIFIILLSLGLANNIHCASDKEILETKGYSDIIKSELKVHLPEVLSKITLDYLRPGNLLYFNPINPTERNWPRFAKFLDNGQIDADFGSLDCPNCSKIDSITITPEQKVLLTVQVPDRSGIGGTFEGVNVDGDPDISYFKQKGNLLELDNGNLKFLYDYGDETPKFIGFQPDKKIIVVSYTHWGSNIYRIDQEGKTDETFGVNGKLKLDEQNLTGLIIQDDGKIVFSDNRYLFRYLANGQSRDKTFGFNGMAVSRLPHNITAIGSNSAYDKFIVSRYDVSLGKTFVETYNRNGDLNDFGDSKERSKYIEIPDFSYDRISTQKDNKILLAGLGNNNWELNITRLLPNGLIDTSFGNSGIVRIMLNKSSNFKDIQILRTSPEGNIIIGGSLQDKNYFIVLDNNGNIIKNFD